VMTAPAEHDRFSRQVKGGIFFGLSQALKAEHLSLREYIEQAWSIVQPTTAFQDNWHIGAIAEHFEAVITGQIQRLVVNIYPRVGKSLLFSILGPTWAWTERPWLEQIFLSYSQRLASDFSRDRRTLIESHWYKGKWGNLVHLSDDQNQKNEFENTARGGMYATSIGGTLTGKGGDLIIIDDGIDPERAESKADREASIRFVKNVVSTRLNDPKRGAIVEVSQRTHKHDISGVLLAEGGYTHLNLPAIAPKRTVIEFPISKTQIVREEGDVLFPARHSKEQIEAQMKRMTPRAARAQILQSPSADENATFKRDCWRFYTIPPEEMIKNMTSTVQSWDCSFKDLKTSSRVAGGVIGEKGPDFYLFDAVARHMGFGATVVAVKAMSAKWPNVHKKLIEDKANGPAVIEQTKKELGGIEAYSPEDSKEARAAVVSAYGESGNLWLPDPSLPGCGWVNDFINECEDFPHGDFNDQVDMYTQAVIWYLNRRKRQPTVTVF
jgi:predicted phage terminase large subunit-like protein